MRETIPLRRPASRATAAAKAVVMAALLSALVLSSLSQMESAADTLLVSSADIVAYTADTHEFDPSVLDALERAGKLR